MSGDEPCENCGLPVVQGAPRGCPPAWFEVIETSGPREYLPHTLERCREGRLFRASERRSATNDDPAPG